MIQAVRNAFSLPDLRKKILYTLLILAIYRLFCHVPVPGVNSAALKEIFASNQLLGILDLLSGGAMATFSVMAMGVYPYITASIILQLLAPIIPALERLLHRATGTELMRRADTQYLMSAPSSEVRVARFVLQLAQRQRALGHSDRRLRLSMTRRDIASYLGVAHETVSRALTALVQDGCIAVSHRDIEITDETGLRELQRMTRGRPPREGQELAA
mgnify:CR=1 FL=1